MQNGMEGTDMQQLPSNVVHGSGPSVILDGFEVPDMQTWLMPELDFFPDLRNFDSGLGGWVAA